MQIESQVSALEKLKSRLSSISPDAKIYRCSIEFRPADASGMLFNDSQPSIISDATSNLEHNFQTTVYGHFQPIKPKKIQWPSIKNRIKKLPS